MRDQRSILACLIHFFLYAAGVALFSLFMLSLTISKVDIMNAVKKFNTFIFCEATVVEPCRGRVGSGFKFAFRVQVGQFCLCSDMSFSLNNRLTF